MKTVLWTINFDTGKIIYVSASTILVAIKNAVWGYNKDHAGKMSPKNVVRARKGKY